MLLQAAMGLAFCSTFIEGFIALKWHAWAKFFARFPLAGLPVSLALSAGLGKIFGMEGVTVGIAGVVSTAASIVMYLCMEYWHENADECTKKWAETKQMGQDLWTIVKWFLRLITLPFRVVRRTVRIINNINTALSRS